MDLDNLDYFKQLDRQNMLAEIDGLPDQLKSAWDLGQTQTLPDAKDIQRVVISGMGDSSLSADLLAALVSSTCSTPDRSPRLWRPCFCARQTNSFRRFIFFRQ